MTTSSRLRGASLGVRMLALVLVPIVAMSFFGVQRIHEQRHAATDAAELVDAVELQQAVARIYPLAQLERLGLEGLARIDELGLPRALVVRLTGVDLGAAYEDRRPELDAALADLRNRFGDVQLTGGQRLGDRLDQIAPLIAEQRELIDAGNGTASGVHDLFESLEATLAEVLAGPAGIRNARAASSDRRVQLDTLADVIETAGERTRVLLRALLYQTPELKEEAARLAIIHEAHLSAHRVSLDPSDRTIFDQVVSFQETVPELPEQRAVNDDNEIDPVIVTAAAQMVLGNLDYLSALEAYSSQFYETVVAEAESNALAARHEVRNTTLLLAAIAALTAMLIGLVVWSVMSPLRHLTRRAEAITSGELHLDPLPVSGPSDVRAVISTTNDMMATLERIRVEMTRLASGDVGPSHATDLPGTIGVTMRESVDRLSSVTSQLQRSEQFAKAIVDEAADAIWTLDAAGTIRSANAAAARLVREPSDQQVGRALSEFVPAMDGEVTIHGQAGTPTRALVVNSAVDVGDEQVTIVIAHDISERTRFEERLAYQASHDALTGLPNRFSLLQHLDERVAAGDEVIVLFVDLDGFKNVNDIRGHAVGDEVLTAVSHSIATLVGDDEFVGRLGGDEFVVVARQLEGLDEAIRLGERIIAQIERPHVVDGQTFVLSASVGIALPSSGSSSIDTIRQADNAVYQAKRRGRGRVEVFDDSLQDRIAHDADLELALRNAVRHDELVLHLQPVHDLRHDRIVAAEALVRWSRPGHGLVMPGDFIQIAERSSLIYEIERWVLREACRHLVAWRQRDPECSVRIAVNISGRHLIDGNLLLDIEHALETTGADPSLLELELTETQLLEDVDRATSILDAVRARGITIAVDDFGTGYSSLTYLRHLPIDTIKIDRSFVTHATDLGYDSTVIEAVLTISRSLDLTVVAEGVETVEQLDYLRRRGCDRAQGFLMARPMPVDEAEVMIFGLASVSA